MKTSKLIIAGLLGLSLFSCQKELDKQFVDPERTNPPANKIFQGMFTATLFGWKLYVQDYGEWYYQMNSGTGIPGYAQISQRYITSRYSWFSGYDDLKTGNGFSDAGLNSYFNDYYLKTRNYGLMLDAYSKLDAASKNEAMFYIKLTSVIKDFGALKLVDFCNSIPYSEAWKGTSGLFFGKYNDPKQIYESVITELKSIGDTLPVLYNQLSATAKQEYANQDFASLGDVNVWVQYCNVMRLKMALRISGVDEAFARPVIADALSRPLPSTDMIFKMPYVYNPPGGETWERGWYENTFASFIPNTILKRMNFGTDAYEPGTDDPRIPAIALPTKYGDYRGVSMNADAQEAAYKAGEKYYAYANDIKSSLAQNSKTMYNHATYHHNTFPGYLMSLAELDLILAEIELKGLGATGKAPGDHIQDAVIHSTNYWYKINAMSSYEPTVAALHPVKPSDAIIAGYAAIVKGKFEKAATLEDKMEILMQQKYIHLNLPGSYELFAELRRTRHPKLEPFTFTGRVMKPVAERIRYPNSEFQTNTENYMKVKDQDNYTTPIFWVPADKRGVTYYRDNYDY